MDFIPKLFKDSTLITSDDEYIRDTVTEILSEISRNNSQADISSASYYKRQRLLAFLLAETQKSPKCPDSIKELIRANGELLIQKEEVRIVTRDPFYYDTVGGSYALEKSGNYGLASLINTDREWDDVKILMVRSDWDGPDTSRTGVSSETTAVRWKKRLSWFLEKSKEASEPQHMHFNSYYGYDDKGGDD